MHRPHSVLCDDTLSAAATPPAFRVGKPGGQRVGKRVGGALYPTWRAGSKLWRLAQNKAHDVV